MSLLVSIHSDGQNFSTRGRILKQTETNPTEFASIRIQTPTGAIGIFGSVAEILNLCEQINQIQQDMLRQREEECQASATPS